MLDASMCMHTRCKPFAGSSAEGIDCTRSDMLWKTHPHTRCSGEGGMCAQVGDELHHVPSGDLDGCCPRGCIAHYASGTILHHGRLSIMRQRCAELPGPKILIEPVQDCRLSLTGVRASNVAGAQNWSQSASIPKPARLLFPR